MRAALLSIGTELSIGQITDTNQTYLSQGLTQAGIDVVYRANVPDDPGLMARAFRELIALAEVVIVTGGLGPTVDDRTCQLISEVTGRPLIEDPVVVQDMEDRFAAYGRTMSPNNRRQALLPDGATTLRNPHGTAPDRSFPITIALLC